MYIFEKFKIWSFFFVQNGKRKIIDTRFVPFSRNSTVCIFNCIWHLFLGKDSNWLEKSFENSYLSPWILIPFCPSCMYLWLESIGYFAVKGNKIVYSISLKNVFLVHFWIDTWNKKLPCWFAILKGLKWQITCFSLDIFSWRFSLRPISVFLALSIGGLAEAFACQHSFISVETFDTVEFELQPNCDVEGRIF